MFAPSSEHVFKQSFDNIKFLSCNPSDLECLRGVALNYIDSIHYTHGIPKSRSLGVGAEFLIPPFRPAVAVSHADSTRY